jgi:hypothetical protein
MEMAWELLPLSLTVGLWNYLNQQITNNSPRREIYFPLPKKGTIIPDVSLAYIILAD